ncbi:hypothetical protein SAMN05518854_1016 [Variovorax sp. YR266]|nr:hypothetical protein SAMN05518854_1016 [Variovorax sp. YR266]
MRSLNPSRHSESLSRLASLSRRLFEMEAQLMTIEEIRTVRKERFATAKKNNQGAEDISSLAAEVAQADRVIRGLKVEMEAYLARYKKLEAEIAQENKAP